MSKLRLGKVCICIYKYKFNSFFIKFTCSAKRVLKTKNKESPIITIPTDVHTRGSQTFGQKPKAGVPTKKDLMDSIKSDIKSVDKDMKSVKDPCRKAYAQSAKKLLKEFDPDKLAKDVIDSVLKSKK